jgi:hypothetical protein
VKEKEGSVVERPTAAVSTHRQEKSSPSLSNEFLFFPFRHFSYLGNHWQVRAACLKIESMGVEQPKWKHRKLKIGAKRWRLKTSLSALWLTSFLLF